VYGSPLAEIKAELTDDNDEQVALYGKVSQPEYPWNVQRFALLLPEPIPNVNAAHGYLLKLKASQPCTVHAVQWFHPMAR
jgi:hypothetical protein